MIYITKSCAFFQLCMALCGVYWCVYKCEKNIFHIKRFHLPFGLQGTLNSACAVRRGPQGIVTQSLRTKLNTFVSRFYSFASASLFFSCFILFCFTKTNQRCKFLYGDIKSNHLKQTNKFWGKRRDNVIISIWPFCFASVLKLISFHI